MILLERWSWQTSSFGERLTIDENRVNAFFKEDKNVLWNKKNQRLAGDDNPDARVLDILRLEYKTNCRCHTQLPIRRLALLSQESDTSFAILTRPLRSFGLSGAT